MTIEEFNNNMNLDAELELARQAFVMAVKDVSGEMVVRIFEEGKAANGGDIGKYNSTKGIYVSDANSPKAGNHKGKPDADGKSKKGKTTYYESYKSFREKQGRESGFVNLRLFGRLLSDLANAPAGSGTPGEAFPIEITPYEYQLTLTSENAAKASGLEKHFGKKIFRHTKKEIKRFYTTLNFEIAKRIGERNA